MLATPFVLLVAVALAASPLALDGRAAARARPHSRRREAARDARHREPRRRCRVDVHLPTAARLDADPTPIGLWLARGERRELRFELTARRWGVHDVGPAIVRARDRLGAPTLDGPIGEAAELRVYAGVERLRTLVAPLRTRPVLGSQVSRELGEGIEFADLRPLAPGDRVRSINWRATARRQHALRQRPAPGAQRRRRPVPRHLRGGRARRGGNARRRGARRRGARLHLPGAARSRGAGEPGRRAELAHRQRRHEAAVPHPRRAVRERGQAELPVEGRHARAAPAASGAGAGDRAEPAAG